MPASGEGPIPRLLTLAGASMEPTLRRGWTVQVAERSSPPVPRQIVVIRGEEALVVHRVVAVDAREPALVFHRGDAGGGIGTCYASDVLGEVVAVVAPMGPIPTLDETSRRSFERAVRRCRLFAFLRRLARAVGIERASFARVLGRAARRTFLR